MTECDWVPLLIEMSHAQNVWAAYCDLVYQAFVRDFIKSRPNYLGWPVSCRLDPISEEKEAGFWHCISTGEDEQNRTPEMRRCERVAWIRAIIENHSDHRVLTWANDNRGDKRCYFWFNEEFVVVLGKRRNYFILITAFCTDAPHTRRKLMREYQQSTNN